MQVLEKFANISARRDGVKAPKDREPMHHIKTNNFRRIEFSNFEILLF